MHGGSNKPPEDRTTSPQPKRRTCGRCGKPDGVPLGEHVLCRDCYFEGNACCPEFGGHDFWKDRPEGEKRT